MLEEVIEELKNAYGKAHEALRRDLSRLRTGRANTSMLDGIRVDYYGTPTPIASMATISVPEPRLLQIKVWERGQSKAVDKAIRESDLGLNPQVDGDTLRIPLPSLTEERRKELARDGVHLARDAVNALAVATVGRELELEHGARRRQGIEDGSAGHEIIRQHKDAVALVGEFKLGGRAHHAEALDPAQFRLAQLLASGHHCTRNCHGHGLTGGHVGCAAHDLPGLVVSGVNAQHVQAIGIGVLIAGEHLAHKERLAVTRRIGDAAGNHLLNGGTGGREALGDLLVGKRCGDLLAQPLEGQLHENCSRKRRSPS